MKGSMKLKRLTALLLSAILGFAACTVPAGLPAAPTTESTQPAEEATMEPTQTPTEPLDAEPTSTIATLPDTPTEQPPADFIENAQPDREQTGLIETASSTAGFESMVAAGLKKRWSGKQAIVVRADGQNSATAKLWLYEYKSGAWRKVAGPWTAVVGKKGVGKQKEGDGRSPSGAFELGTAFGWANKPSKMTYQYRKLDSKDLWVDAAGPYYNRWVRGPKSLYGTGEQLKSVSLYEYAIAVHYNDAAVKNAGSAIFMHVWRGQGQGTAGCTAMSRDHMLQLLRWLNYGKRPILVQGTEAELKKLMGQDWGIQPLPAGWGYVDDFIPDVIPDLRYYTTNNFTGKKVTGYGAPLMPMRMEAITALSKVAATMRSKGYALRVFDAYRPQVSTNAMIAWAKDPKATATKAKYYPDISKKQIPGTYVATKSNHRLGGTVDLSLHKWSTNKDLDMGGTFDFFGAKSHYAYGKLTATQKANRALLRTTLGKQGFAPYADEWWHFTHKVSGSGGTFTIKPREHKVK